MTLPGPYSTSFLLMIMIISMSSQKQNFKTDCTPQNLQQVFSNVVL